MDMKVARGLTESKAFEPTAALQEWDRPSWQRPVDIRSASLALLAALASRDAGHCSGHAFRIG